jgi:hypothetical protein
VAWLVIIGGFSVMAWALLGVFREHERTAPASWFTWVIGGAVLHDAVLLPLVLLVGMAFAPISRPGLRSALRWAVAVGAVVTLASIPVLGRFGARADNPSLLPLPYVRNIVILWCVLLIGAAGVGVLLDWRLARRESDLGVVQRSHAPGQDAK